jgi:hypothetical protein
VVDETAFTRKVPLAAVLPSAPEMSTMSFGRSPCTVRVVMAIGVAFVAAVITRGTRSRSSSVMVEVAVPPTTSMRSRYFSLGPSTTAAETSGSLMATPRYMSSVPARLRNSVRLKRSRSWLSLSPSVPPVSEDGFETAPTPSTGETSRTIELAARFEFAPPDTACTGEVTLSED